MSVCTFLASDYPMKECKPPRDYPFEINLDTGIVYDGGADDNYFLFSFSEVSDYSDKPYGVFLEWKYTEGRANRLIEYIKDVLQHTDSVDLRRVWLENYHEFEDRPFVHRKTVSIDKLTAQHIKDIDEAEIWNKPDKQYPNRPSFYCLTITR